MKTNRVSFNSYLDIFNFQVIMKEVVRYISKSSRNNLKAYILEILNESDIWGFRRTPNLSTIWSKESNS